MEFAEYIKTPKIDKVVLLKENKSEIECSLCVTGHHLIFSTRREDEHELWLLHQAIDHVERSQPRNELKEKLTKDWGSFTQTGGTITIYCKDLRVLKVKISSHTEFTNVADSVEKLSTVVTTHMYAFFYRPMYKVLEDGYTIFRPEHEYAKLLATGAWRLTKVNETYQVCPTYGNTLIVPTAISDDEIRQSAAFREDRRFPIFCYKHGEAYLLRTAPVVAQNGVKRCAADEKILDTVVGRTSKGFIIDLRHGKTLPGDTYTQWRKVNHGIKVAADAFAKLMEACNDTTCTVDKWLQRLESSNWLTIVNKTLNTACVVAQCLDKEGVPVILHGGDATLVVSALVQCILHPDCRTVRGFIALIDREFIQGGYAFGTRHRYSCYSPHRNKNTIPAFLLFLDCVHQLIYQFQWSFEFRTSLLIKLFENSYYSQYGTFIGDCEKDRENLRIYKKTTSYWTHLFRPEVMQTIISPIYDPNPDVIWPSTAPASVELWAELFLRWVTDQSQTERNYDHAAERIAERNRLKAKVIDMRKELLELQEHYDRLCKLEEDGQSTAKGDPLGVEEGAVGGITGGDKKNQKQPTNGNANNIP